MYSRPRTNSKASVPDWYQVYFAAVLEADESRAWPKIQRAGRAIEERLIHLRCAPADNPHELQDLNSALTYLGLLAQNIDAPTEMPSWK